jgi:hypothetical protein
MEALPVDTIVHLLDFLQARPPYKACDVISLFHTSGMLRRKFLAVFVGRILFRYDCLHELPYANFVKHVTGLVVTSLLQEIWLPSQTQTLLDVTFDTKDHHGGSEVLDKTLSSLSVNLKEFQCSYRVPETANIKGEYLVFALHERTIDFTKYSCLRNVEIFVFSTIGEVDRPQWDFKTLVILPANAKKVSVRKCTILNFGQHIEELYDSLFDLHNKLPLPKTLKIFSRNITFSSFVNLATDCPWLIEFSDGRRLLREEFFALASLQYLQKLSCNFTSWPNPAIGIFDVGKKDPFSTLRKLHLTGEWLGLNWIPLNLRSLDISKCLGVTYTVLEQHENLRKLTCRLDSFCLLFKGKCKTKIEHLVVTKQKNALGDFECEYELSSSIKHLRFNCSVPNELQEQIILPSNLESLTILEQNKCDFDTLVNKLSSSCELILVRWEK